MTTPNKTSTSRQDAVLGQPAQCKPDERAIYPVRFSLTGEALDKAAKSGEVPPMPTGLNDKNYELRRLRQGYFYIYSQKHVGKTTDNKGKWLIFKYTVANPKECPSRLSCWNCKQSNSKTPPRCQRT